MRREISSAAYTAFTKLGTVVFFGILVPLTVIFLSDSIGKFLLQILIFLPLSFFMIRWALAFKLVLIGDDGLLISQVNFGKKQELFVPFAKIKGAKQSFFQHFNPESVTIEFTETTVFGEKIKFIPKVRFYPFFDHQIVEELNLLIRLNK